MNDNQRDADIPDLLARALPIFSLLESQHPSPGSERARLLDSLRPLRNQLAHAPLTSIDDESVRHLRDFLELLARSSLNTEGSRELRARNAPDGLLAHVLRKDPDLLEAPIRETIRKFRDRAATGDRFAQSRLAELLPAENTTAESSTRVLERTSPVAAVPKTVTAVGRDSVMRYPLGLDMNVVITASAEDRGRPTWTCRVQRENPDHTWRDVHEGDGASEAFVDVLRHTVTVSTERFRVIRLVPPPEATGERAIEADQTNQSVVVGERVVVKWLRQLTDEEHPATLTLAHLAEVRFLGVPVTHGMLTWRTPSGRDVPCAVATTYLPRARDGWKWGPDLVEQQVGARETRGAADAAGLGMVTAPLPLTDSWVDDFPTRVGRLAARLHLALATPSKVLPEPVQYAGPATVRAWHTAALRRLDAVEQLARAGTLDDAGHVLLPRLPALRAAVDGLLAVAEELPEDPDLITAGVGVVVQRIHGDLHAGQLLRWPGGIAVCDFDGDPALHLHARRQDGLDPLLQPAARDLAQLLLSIDYVGRVADRRSGFRLTAAVDEWSEQAREQLLRAYRTELDVADRRHLLDERLLAAFQAEQVCRELLYACEYLPRWAYAPLAGLRLIGPEWGESLRQDPDSHPEAYTLGRPRRRPDDVLTRALAMHAAGTRLVDIAATFNADGVPTPGGGKHWSPSQVSRLLSAQEASTQVEEPELRT